MNQQLILEFKRKGKIIAYNESCTVITSPICISEEKAADLIKNKRAKLILDAYSATPLEVVNEAANNSTVTIRSCADIRITQKDKKEAIEVWNSGSIDAEIGKEFVCKLIDTVVRYHNSFVCRIEQNVNGGISIIYLFIDRVLSNRQKESPEECTVDNNGVTMTLKRERVSGEKALQRMCEIIDSGGVPRQFSKGTLYYYTV